MTITVRIDASGHMQVVSGHRRLRVMLDQHGKAEVFNATEGKVMYVHEIEGQFLALDAIGQSQLDSATAAVIEMAKRPPE